MDVRERRWELDTGTPYEQTHKFTERAQTTQTVIWTMIHCAVTIVDVQTQVFSMPTDSYFLY